MPLTPEQIQQMNQITGMNKPVSPVQSGAASRIAELRAIAQKAAPAPAPAFPVNNPLENIRTGESQKNLDVGKGAAKQAISDIGSAGAQNAGPVGAEMLRAAPEFAKNIESLKSATVPTNDAQAEGARNTSMAEVVATLAIPAPEVSLAERGVAAAKKGVDAVKSAVTASPEEMLAAEKAQAASEVDAVMHEHVQRIQNTADALTPDKIGKKLVADYAKTVTGKTRITPKSIFQEQGLTPDEQTLNLATRLRDLELDPKDNIGNLQKLEAALQDTEEKLGAALKSQDPEIIYNADKPTLMSKLNSAKIPREFSTIKDDQLLFKNVTDFAKEVVAKADDTIEGLRDARSAFDAQARTEYKNAFKDGGVDLSTPAGRAIRAARDIMNEHLYNTAPNGSEIQNLVGREADIFRATDRVAPQAAQTHGQNGLVQWAKNNPRLARYIGAGASVIGGGFIAHELGL